MRGIFYLPSLVWLPLWLLWTPSPLTVTHIKDARWTSMRKVFDRSDNRAPVSALLTWALQKWGGGGRRLSLTICPLFRENITCPAVRATVVARLPSECPFHHTKVTQDDFWVPGDFYLKPENNFQLWDHTSAVATRVTRVGKRACRSGIGDFHLEGMFPPLKRQW